MSAVERKRGSDRDRIPSVFAAGALWLMSADESERAVSNLGWTALDVQRFINVHHRAEV